MRKTFVSITTAIALILTPPPAQADMFGGDVVVLGQILQQAIQQLIALRSILGNGQDTLALLQDINKGINDSLGLLQTISPNTDPGIYGNLFKAQDALAKLQVIYGIVVPSLDAKAQNDTDENVAEAISTNNSLYEYTRNIDAIGEEIKAASHSVSPGGAQKLTAETLGVMLHVLNAQLRAQATGIKLQAQNLALENKKEKDSTRHFLAQTSDLTSAMKTEKNDFTVPRF